MEGRQYLQVLHGNTNTSTRRKHYTSQYDDEIKEYLSSVRHNGDLTGSYRMGYVFLLERCSKFLLSKTGEDIYYLLFFVF